MTSRAFYLVVALFGRTGVSVGCEHCRAAYGKMLVNMVPACSNVIEVKAGEDRPVRGTASIRSVPVNDKTSWTGPKGALRGPFS